jgi:hypothetical protein
MGVNKMKKRITEKKQRKQHKQFRNQRKAARGKKWKLA